MTMYNILGLTKIFSYSLSSGVMIKANMFFSGISSFTDIYSCLNCVDYMGLTPETCLDCYT